MTPGGTRRLDAATDGPGRYLLRENNSFAKPFEAEIVEWSEAGRVKIGISVNAFWREGYDMPLFVEKLAPRKESDDRYSELIERLRDAANGSGDLYSDQGDYGLCDDAADRIQSLLVENAELKHDLERQMTIANTECNEAERLREGIRATQIRIGARLDDMPTAQREGEINGAWHDLGKLIGESDDR